MQVREKKRNSISFGDIGVWFDIVNAIALPFAVNCLARESGSMKNHLSVIAIQQHNQHNKQFFVGSLNSRYRQTNQ